MADLAAPCECTGLPPVILATIGLLLILPVYYFVTSIHLRRFLPIDMRVTPTAKDLTPKVPAPGQPAAGANAAADGAAGGKQAGAEPGGAKKQGAGDSSKEGSWMGALGNVKGMLANPKDAITSLMTVAKDVGQQNLSKLAQGTTVMHPLDVATVRLSKAFINQNDTVLKWKQLYHRVSDPFINYR